MAIDFYDAHPGTADLYQDVITGLSSPQKTIPPKHFYDTRGSQLFDQICRLPEYYPTRTEISVLKKFSNEIQALTQTDCLLIELGSGASRKVRILIESLKPAAYLAIDIARDCLLDGSKTLATSYPWLDIYAVCADYNSLTELPVPDYKHKLAFFPGSTIGNFEPAAAEKFLARLTALLQPGDGLLIGVDLKKDKAILERAYNDSDGTTAAFNLNMLKRINRELDTDIDPDHFNHDAFYNEQLGRIEMHLISQKKQRVRVNGRHFDFEKGETIHTENSYKYSIREFQDLAKRAGFTPLKAWTDEKDLFSVQYLRHD